MRTAALVLIATLFSTTAVAQSRFDVKPEQIAGWVEPTPYTLPTERGREIADWTSTGLLAAEGGLFTRQVWQSSNRTHALLCAAGRLGATGVAVEGLKRAVKRPRPDASDNYSWPSGHTAWATVMTDGGWSYAFPVTIALGRYGSRKHHLTDVISGAGIGQLAKLICPGGL